MTKEERIRVGLRFRENIGKTIRRWREELHYSLEDASEKMDIPKSTIADYETAKTEISATVMAAFSAEYGFDLKEYLYEKSSMPCTPPVPMEVVIKRMVKNAYRNRPEYNMAINDNNAPYRPPKPGLRFNEITGEWEMYEKTPSYRMAQQRAVPNPPTDLDDEEFRSRIQDIPQERLEYLYEIDALGLIDEQTHYGSHSEAYKRLAKSALHFFAESSFYRDDVRYVKDYINKCKALIAED